MTLATSDAAMLAEQADAATALARARGSRAKILSGFVDLLAVAVAMGLAFAVAASVGRANEHVVSQHLLTAVISLPMWLLFFATHDLYTYRGVANRIDEWRRVVRAVAAGATASAGVGFMLHVDISRGWILLTAILAVATVSAERAAVRWLYGRLRAQGRFTRRIVVVGANTQGLDLVRVLGERPELGQEVVGIVHDGLESSSPVPILGRVDDILSAVRAAEATGVLIASSAVSIEVLNRLVRTLVGAGIHVEISSGLRDIAPSRLRARSAGRFPVTYVEPVHRNGWRPVAKRTFDIVLSAVTLLLASPVLLAAAIAIKLDSVGPVLFRQDRVGMNGSIFKIYKLRTMAVDAEARIIDLRDQNQADGPLFKLRTDPRVTRVGRVLRKLSIDELPQLLNVLKDDMSLVGPRPALPSETEAWVPELFGRLTVKPGITGMWQVSGRSNASFEEYIRLDLYYVDNWSLLTDIGILVKTVPAVVLSRGRLLSLGQSGLSDYEPDRTAERSPRVQVCGTQLDDLALPEALDAIEALVRQGGSHTVVTMNADHAALLRHDREFQDAYAAASLRFADGFPIVLLSRLQGTPLRERVAGSDLLPALCQRAATAGHSVFLLGGGPGVAEAAEARLVSRYPGLEVVGRLAPGKGFEADDEANDAVVQAINLAAPDILFACLGSPKQEIWVHRNLPRLPELVAIGVGAAIDFEAGTKRRAPRSMQRLGLEWAFRLLLEWRRLWRRYLLRDLPYIARAIVAAVVFRRRAGSG